MARRFKEARLYKNMKVSEAIEKLEISQPTLSAWEGERKSPSIDALENMADLYGVTTDYLLGREESSVPSPTQRVPTAKLYIMNGQPVWSPQYGWLLVHATEKMLVTSDGASVPFADAGEIFVSPPLFCDLIIDSEEHPLSRSELHRYTAIWVEPISSDPALREELRGWYQPKGNHVINEFGNRFYLDYYGAKWLAFKSMLNLD